MSEYFVLPFKQDSTGAKILADNLPGKVLNLNERLSSQCNMGSDVVVNWGCGWTNAITPTINHPKAICKAVNKRAAFKAFDEWDVPHPASTTLDRVAEKWLAHNIPVYARETMEGERGRGITVLRSGNGSVDRTGLPTSVCFTKGFPIHREFRIHVAFGKVIEVNEKKRRNGTNPDPMIRSHKDWVFCVYNLAPYPEVLLEESIDAVASLGLDFGGVDIAMDINSNVCVFEVNTAPWINRESTTQAYVKAIKEQYPL